MALSVLHVQLVANLVHWRLRSVDTLVMIEIDFRRRGMLRLRGVDIVGSLVLLVRCQVSWTVQAC